MIYCAIIVVMKGLEISKSFYQEYGIPMVKDQFPFLEREIAVGLIGSGSECFGYDDNISTDHDFDPGFLIFIDDKIDETTKFKLERAYAKLPREYKGYKREIMSPVGGNRRGVKRVSDFLKEKTGTIDGKLSIYDYMSIPEMNLAELVNGEIWRDDSNIIKNVRIKLSTYPYDIKLKKIAGELLIMAQSGQYNFERCISHNELGAARLSLYEFVNATIHTTFLLNEVYMPFYKWKFRALRDLSWPGDIKFEKTLGKLLSISEEDIFNNSVADEINDIAKVFINRLKSDGLTSRDDVYLERHAYEVNNRIRDINIRNMNILAAV